MLAVGEGSLAAKAAHGVTDGAATALDVPALLCEDYFQLGGAEGQFVALENTGGTAADNATL